MTRHLVREASPGEIRTGLFEDGKLVEFRIDRTRQRLKAGEYHRARVLSRLPDGKAIVLVDCECEALLEQAPAIAEGTKLEVRVVRPPLPEPGRMKRAIVRPVKDEPSTPSTADDLPVINDPREIDAANFDELIEAAVVGEFAIDGGMLTIERTRAMTMIDIDGGGDPLQLNLVAAQEIPRLLRLLDIGGQVGIDFLSLPDRKSRLAVDAALADACGVLGQHERTAVNGFGFAQIVRPRTRLSIPEILCGITPGRLSTESRALGLLRLASRSVGHGRRLLMATHSVIDIIKGWPEELAELQKLLGVDIELVPDSSATGYGYVHASQ